MSRRNKQDPQLDTSKAQQVQKSKSPPLPSPSEQRRQQMEQQKKQGFNPDKYVTPTVSREEVIELKQSFDIFDDDLSGTIDPSELKAAFEQIGFTGNSKFIYQILAELDKDNSGGIDFDEYYKLATLRAGLNETKKEIAKAFNLFDWNREGRITWDELKKVAQDLGEKASDEEIKAMFKKADLDDDGFVTFEDFYNIMTNRVYYD